VDYQESKKPRYARSARRYAISIIAGPIGFDVVFSSGLTLNQRVSGSSPERPTTTEALAEKGSERFSLSSG
jgi:hypothetical protein